MDKMLQKMLRTMTVTAACLIAVPALAGAQPPDLLPPAPPTPFGVYGGFAIGGVHTAPVSGLGLQSGLSVRLGPVFVQANGLDLAMEQGAGSGFDYVDEGGTTYCEDADGEIVDDMICDGKTPDIIRYAASVEARVFVPHTSMIVGVGDRFDHGSQTVFGTVGYVFAPDDTRSLYILSISAGEHFVSASIGVAVPLFTR